MVEDQNSPPRENGFHAEREQDIEPLAAVTQSKKLRQNKRIKCFAYVVAFVVFQTAIIALFALTFMKIRTPKFRVQSATFDNFTISTSSNPRFDIRMNAQLMIKNTNFGSYKYQNTTVGFNYNGFPIGEGFVSKSKVGWRKTKKINVLVDLSSNTLPTSSQLGNDLISGELILTSQAKLNGKVELFQILFKKKKLINLDCDITISLSEKVVSQISCH